MQARIYQPARNAMQSGQAKTKNWVMEFVPAQTRQIDPLMGWTGSGDMNSQVRLTFDSKEAAIDYAKENGIACSVTEPQKRKHIVRSGGYGENFATNRRAIWTH
ncbi:MAG: ETC complex I subunit [Rhodobacteraceae bacterium]|nr:ETC complex I subunit [Paracoccaceae bacterium]